MSPPPARSALVELLNDASTPYRDPLARLGWDGVETQNWWLPPQALSLSGDPEFEALPPSQRRRLSHYEFAHLMEAGLWLQSLFMRRLGNALDSVADPLLRSRYLHEIREEAGHSLMFLELMRRSGVRIEGAARLRPRFALMLHERLSAGSALFWSLVVASEELPDKLTRSVRQGAEAVPLSGLVHQLATMHIIEEARHIAHARAMCMEHTRAMAAWRRALLSPVLSLALRQFARYLYFPQPAVYVAAGLPPDVSWAARARRNPKRVRWVESAIKPTLEFLRAAGWRMDSPHG